MKNIIVKVNDAARTVQQINVATNDGKPTVLKAVKNVNYQLVDAATGKGPDHIITKRVGKNLHISFEDAGKDTDLIIEDFYADDSAALIGQAENGQYYYYIPDTGDVADYVTQLANGDTEGQALGGNSVLSPWWVGVAETKAAIWPWLLGGLAAAGAAAAALAGNKKSPAPAPVDNADQATITAKDDGSVTVKPGDDNTQIKVEYTDEAGRPQTKTFTKGANGKWTDPDANDGINIDPNTGVVTVPADKVKDGSPVKVTAENGKGNPTVATVNAKDPADAPAIDANNDGSVTVTPAKDNTKLTVEFKDENGQPQTKVFTKGTNGKWTDPDANDGVSIDPTTGVVTIANTAVKDNDTVKVTAENGKGTPAVAQTVAKPNDNTAPAVKIVGAEQDGQIDPKDVNTQGEATAKITAPSTAKVGDTITVTVPDGNNGTKEVKVPVTNDVLTKGATVTFKPNPEGKENVVKAQVSTPAGSKGGVGTSKPATTDLKTPGDKNNDGIADDAGKPVVEIQDKNDGDINKADLDAQGNATAKITLPKDSGYSVGDTIVVTKPDGTTQEIPVDSKALKDGVEVKFKPQPEGKENVVKAVVKDKQGNTSFEGKDSSKTDLKVPGDSNGDGVADDAGKPVVKILDGDKDGINANEVDGSGKVTAEISNLTPANGYSEGDVITVTNPDGTTQKVTITPEILTAGKATIKFTPKAEGENNVVKAQVADKEGNKSGEGKDESVTDLQTAAPTVATAHNDTDKNGTDDSTTISGKTEPNATVTIKVAGKPDVKVTANNNGEYTHTTDKPLANGTKVEVVAKAANKNPSEAENAVVGQAKADTKAPTVNISIADNDGNNDGVVQVGKPAKVTITLADENGVKASDPLTANDLEVTGGKIVADSFKAVPNKANTYEAMVTPEKGNAAQPNQNLTVKVKANAVTDNSNNPNAEATGTVKITDTTAPELQANPISYPENKKAGDVLGTVKATDNDSGVTGYTIASGNTDGFFEIDNQGNIKLTDKGAKGAANDYETGANSFTLGITANNPYGKQSPVKSVELKVADVNEKIAPISFKLKEDTFGEHTKGTATDKLTKKGDFVITGEPNAKIEYSLDNGKTWKVGTEGTLTNTTGSATGTTHYVKVRQTVGGVKSAEETHTVVVDDRVALNVVPTINKIGGVHLAIVTEKGSYVEVADANHAGRTIAGRPTRGGTQSTKLNYKAVTVDEKGVAKFDNAIPDQDYAIRVTDQAGNVKEVSNPGYSLKSVPNIYGNGDGAIKVSHQDSEHRVEEIVRTGSQHDLVLVGKKAHKGNFTGYGDVGGNILGHLELDLQDGNDAIIATSVQAGGGKDVDLRFGNGDDTLQTLEYIYTQVAGSNIKIDMGAGNDMVSVNTNIRSGGGITTIDMGEGNDVFELGGGIAPNTVIKGGNGYDVVQLGTTAKPDYDVIWGKNFFGFEEFYIGPQTKELELTIKDIDSNNLNGTLVINGSGKLDLIAGNGTGDFTKTGDRFAHDGSIHDVWSNGTYTLLVEHTIQVI